MRNILILLLLFLLSSKSYAQNSFGIEFGTYYETYSGINDLDSIRVVTNNSDYGEMLGGGFYEITFTDRLSLHNKFLIRPIYIDNIVFNNNEQCQFCPVEKVTLTPVTNLSLEVLPQLELIKINKLKVKIFGGLNTSFNFRIEQPEVSFNGRHQGVEKVINSMDKVVEPVTFSLVYGASAEYKRFIIWIKNQYRSNYSREIEVSGKKYNFSNTWQFLNLSIGYRFYSFKNNK